MKRLLTFALRAVLLCPVISFAQPVDAYSTDVRGTHLFFRTINPRLPRYVFQLVGDSELNAINEIRCSREDGTGGTQILRVDQVDSPPAGSEYFETQDMNFDDYKDIKLLEWWGTGGNSFMTWLFDTTTGGFIYNEPLSHLRSAFPDPHSKRIHTSFREGWMHTGTQEYEYQGNMLVLVRSESMDWLDDQKRFLRVISVLRNGEMQDSLRQYLKMDE